MIAKRRQSSARKHYKITTHPIPHKKPGRILYDIPHKRRPHEEETAQILLRWGANLTFLKDSKRTGVHNPDCLWRGNLWEFKALFTEGSNPIYEQLKKASSQSDHILIDASRIRRPLEQVAKDVINYHNRRYYHGTKDKTIMVIDKDNYCIITKDMLS